MVLTSCVNGQINCPDSSLVSPCVCGDNGDGLTVSLNCFARNVNDAKVSDILDAFLAPSSRANPIGYLNLGYNPITAIPSQVTSLRELHTVGMGSTDVSIIKTNAFNFRREANLIDFRLCLINKIESGAFQGTREFKTDLKVVAFYCEPRLLSEAKKPNGEAFNLGRGGIFHGVCLFVCVCV